MIYPSISPSVTVVLFFRHCSAVALGSLMDDKVTFASPGRYLFLNAIANQLRYPNSHTHYFSCVLLYLFAEANTEAIQEQITRCVHILPRLSFADTILFRITHPFGQCSKIKRRCFCPTFDWLVKQTRWQMNLKQDEFLCRFHP